MERGRLPIVCKWKVQRMQLGHNEVIIVINMRYVSERKGDTWSTHVWFVSRMTPNTKEHALFHYLHWQTTCVRMLACASVCVRVRVRASAWKSSLMNILGSGWPPNGSPREGPEGLEGCIGVQYLCWKCKFWAYFRVFALFCKHFAVNNWKFTIFR